MTRKRTDKRAKQAVPEEILAEGSGPNEVVEADAQALADAASEATQRSVKRGRKAKQAVDAWGQPVEPAEADAADESSEEISTDDAAEATVDAAATEVTSEEAPAAKKAKRGRKAKGRAANEDAAEQGADEAIEARSNGDDHIEGDESSDGADGDDESIEAADAASDEPSEEARSEQSLEDAVMRAEAEAELGAAAPEGEGGDAAGEGGEASEDGDVAGAALPTTAASMDDAQLKNLVEALVFAADKPVTMQRLRQLTRVSEVKRLEHALAEIAADYTNRGIALQHVSGGYQFRTNTSYSVWVQQLIAGRPVRLSRAQLETLSIVAYRQPITRPEVDEIRGVDSSATLRLLLDRSLIRVLGKKEDVGRPVLYGTTKEFLDFFSLQDLRELPTLREYSELTAESRKVMSDRLGLDADGNTVDENGNPIDADGNPLDDGTDVLPDAPVDSMAASTADPGAEDEAAIEAVSAVTDVIGIEEERIDTTLPDDEQVEASSSDEHVAASSDEHAAASSDEHAAASSDEDATASSDEHVSSESSDDEVLAASHDAAHDADEPVEASSSDDAAESRSEDVVESRSEDHVVSASSDDEVLAASHDAAHDADEPQGMPRGASQADVIGGLDDEADSDELQAGDADLDAPDDAAEASEPGLDAGSHAHHDVSASESLDETDKSPAE